MRRFRPSFEDLEERITPVSLSLTPSADNTLYQDPSGQLSNGAGQHFYVGKTAQSTNNVRRGALKFDLSAVPAGSTITSATLTLNMSRSKFASETVGLHRALANWGEGTSNAALGGTGSGEGDGIQAAPGDVTWLFTFFNSASWSKPGGDFVAAASASTFVSTSLGKFQWTGDGLIADVQQWLNNPATDFGWILTGDESTTFSAKEFDTKESITPANRPVLALVFTAPAAPPDLTIAKSHIGNLKPGDSADTYTLTVNNSGQGPTAGTVTVADTLPIGLAPTSADAGIINGWSVAVSGQTVTATRSDVLAGGAAYPALNIIVSVAGNAPGTLTNTATVAGGGEVNTSNDSASDPTTILVTSGFQVGVVGSSTTVAGNALLFTVQAVDQFGNAVTRYNGLGTVAIAPSPGDPLSTLPNSSALNASGFGFFLGTFRTKGSYTVSATAPSLAGTSSPISVTPANAAFFSVAAPATTLTGASFNVTVKAFDQFQNLATGYAGKVHLTSSDAKATLPNDSTLTGGIGTLAVTLNSAGNQTITATDALSFSPITISGLSAAIVTSGLTVTSFSKTPTGFTAAFNKAITPADLTIYGSAGAVQDVLLVGKNSNSSQPYPGTLIVDASKKLVTFNVSANFLTASSPGGSAALPDDTYTVTLLSGSGSNGFQDTAGQGLDDGHGGHADFIGTFTTTYQRDQAQVLGIVDFARGPNASGDTGTLVKVPNDPANGGHVGIPITIYNAVNLTSAGFTLTYNANILTVTGGISDPSNASAMFHMTSNVMSADSVHSVATFLYTRATPQSGTQILGDITAFVPNAARSQYQVKDLLALGAITVNGGAAVVPANAVDVNAYFGDVNGDHHLDALDKGLIANVAATASTGFSAFTLLDPAIIGDLSGDNAVTSNSTSLLSNYLLGIQVAKIPALPNPAIADNLFTSPFSFDPTLSLPAAVQVSSQGIVNVPVLLDQPRPQGSTGLVEAELALKYDPAVLSVSAADITLGSIPSQGIGWQLAAVVDSISGTISIQIYSQTAIARNEAGSLVNIAFHFKSDRIPAGMSTVQLVDSMTVLADAQAAMVLDPGQTATEPRT